MDRAKQPSLREHALSIIRDAIATGELAEDRIYSAAGLAKQLGISLSPVREAMMALVTEGTVEAVPNRGFRLVPITEADLEEIIRIRVLLAVPAVRQLCDRLAEAGPGSAVGAGSAGSGTGSAIRDELRRLRTHAEATVAAAVAGDLVAFYTHDRRFHESLLAFGLGRRAAEISLRLRDQSRIGHLSTADAGPGDEETGSAESSGAGSSGAGTKADAGADSSGDSVTEPGSVRSVGNVAVTSAKELIDIVDLIEANRPDVVADLVTRNLYFFKRTEASVSDASE